jgi:protein disulfide-isomerase A6
MFRALALLALVALAAAQVTVLTPDNFDQVVNGDRGVFVKFFAPWCGHCKSMAPAYEEVATAFARYSKDVVIAEVDCDQHRDIGSRYGVSGFPTLKYFPKGSTTPLDYSSGRSAEDILKYVNEKAGLSARLQVAPSDVVVLTEDNFDEIVMDVSKDVLVEFYAPWCGHCKNLAPIYEKVATTFKNDKNVVVAKMDADHYREAPSRYGVSGYPTLKWFPRSNKEGEDYSAGRAEDDFVSFINNKAGTQRVAGGRLSADAGRFAELDALAKDFADESRRDAILAEAKSVAAAKKSKDADLYVKIMEKIVEKGNSYAANELARLDRMLASGNVKADKVDDFTKRRNILGQF